MLPKTLYRKHIEDCRLPQNAYTFEFMGDYLTMMDVLAKAITHRLSDACGITPLQYRIMLRLLSEHALHSRQLADDLCVRMSTISVAVSKLVAKGCVARRDNINDMREIMLSLTDTGREMVANADEAILRVMADYWNTLTEEQLRAAVASSLSAVERHSHTRMQDGRPRYDTALVDTVFISRRLTQSALQDYGLTISDYRVLLALKVAGGPCSGADISNFLFLNSSDIALCLKSLEKFGLITRERSLENRRVRMIALTDSGEERTAELLPVVFDALHETCHSDDEALRIHISAARDLVSRRRNRNF